MNAPTLEHLQQQVSELLLRHRSLMDVMSKYGQTGATVNRAVTKAVTECGCIQLHAKKQNFTDEIGLQEAKSNVENHLSGQLCEHCRDAIKDELGRNLFYMSALSNLLDINLNDVVDHETQKCTTLGLFKLS
ncbi:DUF1573 domain-containing protein [Paenibacillus sp. GCM10012307]|uniref:DUF1573 domain-containing protein n=1 Tax=Paenibacillus roseus TaxID=2798579 RepID=A0A934J0D6_9BACL|nr:DUF1573 domain-containing protein [Paenibacillus roseus]MBJ6361004.1 DUF1573 domain-containing protein [Paenibacillus roseus]